MGRVASESNNYSNPMHLRCESVIILRYRKMAKQELFRLENIFDLCICT